MNIQCISPMCVCMCSFIWMVDGGCWVVHPELTIEKEKLATEKYNLAVFIRWQLKKNWFDGRIGFYHYPRSLLHIADQVFVVVLHIIFFLSVFCFSFTFSLSSVVLNGTSSEYYFCHDNNICTYVLHNTAVQNRRDTSREWSLSNGSIYGW